MPQEATIGEVSKFQRYRASRRAQGMKLLRVWLPDPRTAGFAEEASRQAALLRGAPEETEALLFIEAAASWDDQPG